MKSQEIGDVSAGLDEVTSRQRPSFKSRWNVTLFSLQISTPDRLNYFPWHLDKRSSQQQLFFKTW
jgi:hypothetical protein